MATARVATTILRLCASFSCIVVATLAVAMPGRPQESPWFLLPDSWNMIFSTIVHLDPAVTQGMDNSRRAVIDRELLENRCDMVLDRLVADLQRFSNLFIAIAARDVVEYFNFAAGERRVEVFCVGVFFFDCQFAERFEDATGQLGLESTSSLIKYSP